MKDEYEARRDETAAWLSAVDRAERDGKPVPGWASLEEIASSLPSAQPRNILRETY